MKCRINLTDLCAESILALTWPTYKPLMESRWLGSLPTAKSWLATQEASMSLTITRLIKGLVRTASGTTSRAWVRLRVLSWVAPGSRPSKLTGKGDPSRYKKLKKLFKMLPQKQSSLKMAQRRRRRSRFIDAVKGLRRVIQPRQQSSTATCTEKPNSKLRELLISWNNVLTRRRK